MKTKPETTELLPCPFCASDANSYSYAAGKKAVVHCSNQECIVFPEIHAKGEQSAIAAWNTRHQPTPSDSELVEENKRLRDALEEISGHGVSQSAAMNLPEDQWAWRCFNRLQAVARQALKPYLNGGES